MGRKAVFPNEQHLLGRKRPSLSKLKAGSKKV